MVTEEERLDIAEACYAEGFDEGKAQGKAEVLEQMAKALASMGMSESDIQKAINLAKES